MHDATSKGARVVAGGERATVSGKGRFFQATLLDGMTHAMALMQRESFGPILPVAPVDSDDDALRLMNDSRASASRPACGRAIGSARGPDGARARVRDGLHETGATHWTPALPWTGVKDSGRGVTLSALGFDGVTRPKAIHFRLAL